MKNKIAFISEHASPLATIGGVDSGGQNVYVAELARHLVSLGYEVDVFTRWENPSLPQIVNWQPGVRVVHAEAGPREYLPKEELLDLMPQFRESMIEFISRHKPGYSLIHANFWMSGLVALQIKEILQIPYVITFHALGHIRKIYQKEEDKFPASRMDFEEEIARKADRIIAECPQDMEDLISYYNAPENKISIVPCGFNQDEFYPIDPTFARHMLNLDTQEKIILQLGRMVPRKGIDNVICSLEHLKHHADLRLVIVGGETDDPAPEKSPELKRLLTIASELGVSEKVTFTGRKNRNMLKYYYSAADIFITTPWYEPFGITPLEAMACGTPVIGSNVGGIKYSVADKVTGFLIPPNNPSALAEKIDSMLSNQIMMDSMKANAIHRVNSLFTWSHVAKKVAAIYSKIEQTLQHPASLRREEAA